MQDLARTSLTSVERRAVERFVELLQADYGAGLRSVWLYGSRARGEPRRLDSDVDLLVVADGAGWEDFHRVGRLLDEAAESEGANPVFFSAHVYDPDYLANRREIRSFFMQEVDRDKIVLAGEP